MIASSMASPYEMAGIAGIEPAFEDRQSTVLATRRYPREVGAPDWPHGMRPPWDRAYPPIS